MFKLIPLQQISRNSSSLLEQLLIHPQLEITNIYKESHAPYTHGHVGTEHYLNIIKINQKENWYANIYERNNLLILSGERQLDLWCKKLNQKVSLLITEDQIFKNGRLYYGCPAVISWDGDIYHKLKTKENKSISINFTENNYYIEEMEENKIEWKNKNLNQKTI